MKYLAIYSIVYAILLVAGWYSPNVPTAAVVGLSHLGGLVGVLGWRATELADAMNKRTAAIRRELSRR